MLITYGRENEKTIVAAQCTNAPSPCLPFIIKPAQLGESKTLCYINGCCVFFPWALVNAFHSIVPLIFAFSELSVLSIATLLTLFQASEAEHS